MSPPLSTVPSSRAPAATVASPGLQPSLADPVEGTHRIRDLIAEARATSRVKTRLPAFFNPLFRKQGPVNSLLLDALSDLANQNEQLVQRNQELTARQLQFERDLATNARTGTEDLQHLRALLRSHLPVLAALDQRFVQSELDLAEVNQRSVETEKRLTDHQRNVEATLAASKAELQEVNTTLRSTLGAEMERRTNDKIAELCTTVVTAIEKETSAFEIKLGELRGELNYNVQQLAALRAAAREFDAAIGQVNTRQDKFSDQTMALIGDLRRRSNLILTALSAQSESSGALDARVERLECLAVSQADPAQPSLATAETLTPRVENGASSPTHAAGEVSHSQAADAAGQVASEELQERFSRFYLAFENRFRGTRTEIREKQARYLPYLQQTAERVGLPADQIQVRDLGCGRGEWLELARDGGFTACEGVDANPTMVAECHGRGLVATHSDVLTYLSEKGDGSLHFITVFHVIEHLSLVDRFDLYRQVHRTLAVGGVAIFETPNPENIIVGACNFYMDPTHIHPLVPTTEEFVLKHVGFAQVQIERLHPFDPKMRVTATGDLADQFNQFFYGPQDFALICLR